MFAARSHLANSMRVRKRAMWAEKLEDAKAAFGSESLCARALCEDEFAIVDGILESEPSQAISIEDIIRQIEQHPNDPTTGSASVVLEAILSRKIASTTDIELLVAFLKRALEIPQRQWNWQIGSKDPIHSDYYYSLRLLRVLLTSFELTQPQVQLLMVACSVHINPHVPWSCAVNSSIVLSILKNEATAKSFNANMMSFIEIFKENLIKFDFARSSRLHGGLRPRLGYGGAKREILEEDARRNWKDSAKVKSLSMVWFCVAMITVGLDVEAARSDSDWYSAYWNLITSFLLNLGDDHDPAMKYQNLEILRFLLAQIDQRQCIVGSSRHLLHQSGLLHLFIEQTKTCLAHLPPVTPLEISRALLEVAYPCLWQLLEIKQQEKECKIEFTEVLTVHILPSISTMTTRFESNIEILDVLVQTLTDLVHKHLKYRVLISINRVNFTLNQVMVNMFISEENHGAIELVRKCLECQLAIVEEILGTQQPESQLLLQKHRYDFLGAWVVVVKRLVRIDVEGPIIEQVKANFKAYLKLDPTIETDMDPIYEVDPGLKLALTKYQLVN